MFSKILLLLIVLSFLPANAKINNNLRDNEKQFGKEFYSKQFSEGWAKFAGRKIYQCPLFGWQIEVLYKDGKSYSETARPKGKLVKKNMILEQEANVIADILFDKKDRGDYKKQIKNANFISHFFDNGVVSYEMKLDDRRNNHVGIIGIRTILYSNGDKFKDIKVNAYQ